MRERLEDKGAPPDRLRVIPNWVDTHEITPRPRDNAWALQHDLVSRFVVMHSGNVGHAQDADSLVQARRSSETVETLQVVIAGFRAAADACARVASRSRDGSILRTRSASDSSCRSRCRRSRRRSRKARRVCRPEPPVWDPLGGPPGNRRRRGRGLERRLVGVGCGVVIPPSRPDLLAHHSRAADGLESDEMGRAAVRTSRRRPTALSRWSGTARSSASCSERNPPIRRATAWRARPRLAFVGHRPHGPLLFETRGTSRFPVPLRSRAFGP